MAIAPVTVAAQPLFVAYPPPNHQTTVDRIFLIGTAPPSGQVLVNGNQIPRTQAGHFAPTFPLQVGENVFTLRYNNQEVKIKVTRQPTQATIPLGLAFAKDSLTPKVDVATLPGEYICFGAIAPMNAQVSVKLAGETIPLKARSQVELPDNKSVLLGENSPIKTGTQQYQGCAKTPPNPPELRGGIESDTPELRGGIESDTPELRGGIESDTPELRGGIESDTPELRGGIESDTPELRGGIQSDTSLAMGGIESDTSLARGGIESDTSLARGGIESDTSLAMGNESNSQINNSKKVDLGVPVFELTMNNQTVSQQGTGKISILSPADLEVAEVTAEPGVARTGASTDFSRMTPLPKGTRATIIGREGEWIRLDYGAWIKASEVKIVKDTVPPRSLIRSARSRQVPGWTEVLFPLEIPVPVTVQEGERAFTLTLYNTTAQTDIIRLDDDPVISRLTWQQLSPLQLQYTFNLKSAQQWGYKLRYDGTTLVLSLKHPPVKASQMANPQAKPLSGIKILLDPGHGGPEDSGGVGPTGYREKTVALIVSKLVRQELVNRGANVVMTRVEDVDLDLPPRVEMIQKEAPAIAISLHYNALPDNGDAINTKGVGAFWFHPQAHSLAMFLHNYLVAKLNRPSYGVFWNNLAMTRPAVAPSVLMELGFMINPDEFEWIVNGKEQQKLAEAIAQGITEWFASVK
ncbi:MAG: N-acetylmuramoyl-L-alanine amidase [Oscillatoriales cyanobacterium]|nr:MAG: N-acetylmuramoyl-L-alanine amidase [Oscillatoriales cyanobacterium]TAD95661.1 MAG: N-acetylmuramoyl-L-alanine amidase [Oscillatoriales cyanobacterium]TAE02754.1 MAG: N-acetylmuramoyl-L-alanine amidase [Oscillatoriales cyanobacterium]TAF00515.1 MAG: N-acetylmuramoyl-L-alanine amidase [Oscillatoriales cyanobacterium]TAF70399.1 MAG: N-acetylmuramoyl-L-alanine amidase [Oscillatoriales cyanobacterium]